MPNMTNESMASQSALGSLDTWRSRATDDGPEPLVVGAIGRSRRPEILQRMVRFGQLESLVDESDLAVLSSAPLPGWRTTQDQGLYWRRLDRSVIPSSQQQAWLESGSPGLAWTQHDIVLHTDLLGVWPLFYTRQGRAIYFSNRLAPVIAAAASPSLDVMAWASMLATRSIPPGRSPVAEVGTMKPQHALRFRRATEDTDWVVGPPVAASDSATVSDLVESIQVVLTSASPITLALSGGYDSRFLLACGLAASPESR